MKNLKWFWQRKQDKKENEYIDFFAEQEKSKRKELRKKLNEQTKANKHSYKMDEEIFENVKKMLGSVDNEDIELARNIIFNSSIPHSMMNELVAEHCELILHGPVVHLSPHPSASLYIYNQHNTSYTKQ